MAEIHDQDLGGGLAGVAAQAFGARAVKTMTLLCALCITAGTSHAGSPARDRVQHAVDEAIRPLMAKDKIPGIAVGIIVDGKPAVFNFGVASTQTHKPVTNDTLFELGSVT